MGVMGRWGEPGIGRQEPGTMSAAKLVLYGVLAVAVLTLPYWVPRFQVFLAIRVLFLGLASMSFVLLAGFGGMISLAQVAFYGIAGYVVGIGSVYHGWPFGVAVPLALLAAVILGILFGFIAARSSGLYFLMMTLAMGQLMYNAAMQWASLTGGYNGINGIPSPELFGIAFDTNRSYYYFTLLPVVLAYLALRRIVRSPFGIALQGIRDGERRMAALGFDTRLHKHVAIVVSSFFAGLAGVIAAYFYGSVAPDVISLNAAVMILFVALLGGVSRLEGGFLGALAYVAIEDIGSQFTERYHTVIGIFFVLVVLFLPQGIASLRLRGRAGNARRLGPSADPGGAGGPS